MNEEVGERALSKNPAIGHAVQGDPARHAERFHLGFLLKMVHKTYAYYKRLQPARIQLGTSSNNAAENRWRCAGRHDRDTEPG